MGRFDLAFSPESAYVLLASSKFDFDLNLPFGARITIFAIIVVYFLLITGFGTYFSRYSKDINDFFFSGQRFSWWIAAASMVATGIGSYSYLKYSEQGLKTGMSGSMTYMNDWFIVPFFMFGWLPIIYYSKVHSIPEYFERRFNSLARYIAMLTILAYLMFYIGYNLFTIGLAIEGIFGFPMIYSVPIVAAFLGVYVTFGGQTAVIFTDLFQGIMLYIAGGIAIFAGFWALGGLAEWWSWLPVTHRLPFVDLHTDPNFNSAGLFWGEALAGSIAFSFMNQGFLMRYLSIKSVNEGRKAVLFNVVVTLPLSAIVVGCVGWLAKALLAKQAAMGGQLAGLDPIIIKNSFHTFIVVVWECIRHSPILFGFIIAALTAALMSTIDTYINACAAIAIYDIYKPIFKKKGKKKHYLKAARVASAIATIVGTLLVVWFYYESKKENNSLMAIHYRGVMTIIPSIVTTIFLGAFWKRFTPIAACVSMILGSVLTVMTNFHTEWIEPLSHFVCGPIFGDEVKESSNVYIYMRALFGMSVTAVIGIVVSFMTKEKPNISGLTAGTVWEGIRAFKGKKHGEPNFEQGGDPGRLTWHIDNDLRTDKIAVAQSVADCLKSNVGDILYITDARSYLGGLRSNHVRLVKIFPDVDEQSQVILSKKSANNAYLLPDKKIRLEKIL